jgi:O-antigen/teichoic acid export membrane protein
MATGWLLGVATDAGLSMHLARETARDRRHGRQLLYEVIGLRTGLAFFAATITALLTPYLVPAHWRMQFVVIVLAQLAGAVIETVAHYFRGLQRSEIESTIHSGYRLATLAWAMVVLWRWRRLDYLGVAMLVPALVAMAVSMAIAARLSVRLKADATEEALKGSPEESRRGSPSVEESLAGSLEEPLWDPASAGLTPGTFVRNVLPLGAGVLVSALYFRCDVYFIQQWHGFQPVGGYNAAFRLVEALRLLPAAVMAVTFPILVQATDTQLVKRIGGGLAVAGSALAVVCALGGPFIIPAIYGDTYAYAAPAFSILALALPLFFLNYALTHQVIGWDGQRAYLLIATLALAANIAANLAFVPAQGIVGAAIATVLTEVVVTIGCIYVLWRMRTPSRSARRATASSDKPFGLSEA